MMDYFEDLILNISLFKDNVACQVASIVRFSVLTKIKHIFDRPVKDPLVVCSVYFMTHRV